MDALYAVPHREETKRNPLYDMGREEDGTSPQKTDNFYQAWSNTKPTPYTPISIQESSTDGAAGLTITKRDGHFSFCCHDCSQVFNFPIPEATSVDLSQFQETYETPAASMSTPLQMALGLLKLPHLDGSARRLLLAYTNNPSSLKASLVEKTPSQEETNNYEDVDPSLLKPNPAPAIYDTATESGIEGSTPPSSDKSDSPNHKDNAPLYDVRTTEEDLYGVTEQISLASPKKSEGYLHIGPESDTDHYTLAASDEQIEGFGDTNLYDEATDSSLYASLPAQDPNAPLYALGAADNIYAVIHQAPKKPLDTSQQAGVLEDPALYDEALDPSSQPYGTLPPKPFDASLYTLGAADDTYAVIHQVPKKPLDTSQQAGVLEEPSLYDAALDPSSQLYGTLPPKPFDASLYALGASDGQETYAEVNLPLGAPVHKKDPQSVRSIMIFPCGHIRHSCQETNHTGCNCKQNTTDFAGKALLLTLPPEKQIEQVAASHPRSSRKTKLIALGVLGLAAAGAGLAFAFSSSSSGSSQASSEGTSPSKANCTNELAELAYQNMSLVARNLSYVSLKDVALVALNASACNTMATVVGNTLNFANMSHVASNCYSILSSRLSPLKSYLPTAASVDTVKDNLIAAQNDTACKAPAATTSPLAYSSSTQAPTSSTLPSTQPGPTSTPVTTFFTQLSTAMATPTLTPSTTQALTTFFSTLAGVTTHGDTTTQSFTTFLTTLATTISSTQATSTIAPTTVLSTFLTTLATSMSTSDTTPLTTLLTTLATTTPAPTTPTTVLTTFLTTLASTSTPPTTTPLATTTTMLTTLLTSLATTIATTTPTPSTTQLTTLLTTLATTVATLSTTTPPPSPTTLLTTLTTTLATTTAQSSSSTSTSTSSSTSKSTSTSKPTTKPTTTPNGCGLAGC